MNRRFFIGTDLALIRALDAIREALPLVDHKAPHEILLRPYDKTRSLEANAAFHATLGEIARATGESAEDLKFQIKDAMGEYRERLIGERTVRIYNTSADWSKKKMSEAMTRAEAMAGERGVRLTAPDNWHEGEDGN